MFTWKPSLLIKNTLKRFVMAFPLCLFATAFVTVASVEAGTAKVPLLVPIAACPPGTLLSHSFEVLEDRTRDGVYDYRTIVNCDGEIMARPIPGSTQITIGMLPTNHGLLSKDFSYEACFEDGYSWNVNFLNSSNQVVAVIGRNCNDNFYSSGLTEYLGSLPSEISVEQLLVGQDTEVRPAETAGSWVAVPFFTSEDFQKVFGTAEKTGSWLIPTKSVTDEEWMKLFTE